jgi:hypothetical protein
MALGEYAILLANTVIQALMLRTPFEAIAVDLRIGQRHIRN